MKKLFYLVSSIAIIAVLAISCQKESVDDAVSADSSIEKTQAKGPHGCTTIQSGELVDSEGNPIETGYDAWGYNYQAQMFNGYYCDSYRNAPWCQVYADVELIMKWNDAWLSNKDCDDDGLLDRHYGFDSFIGSGAWLTNHMKGMYLDANGAECYWDYFVKIVAAPEDAIVEGGNWVNADGTVMGPVIWGEFAVIQEVENDPCAGIEGLQFNSPDHSGLVGW